MEYYLPYFGSIDLMNLKEDYQLTADILWKKISLDINLESKTIDEGLANTIKNFLENIEKLDQQHKMLIEKDFEEDGETADYINFYLDEFEEDELLNITADSDKTIPLTAQLISKLKLIRVGLYPDGKYGAAQFGILDYSIDIDGGPCNQLLVIKTNELGDLDHITWES